MGGINHSHKLEKPGPTGEKKQMRWEKEDLPSLPLNWKRRKREKVGRIRKKEMVDIQSKAAKINLCFNLF